nr:MAG TPA: hypothetical protein [Caudoviricetes sp.]
MKKYAWSFDEADPFVGEFVSAEEALKYAHEYDPDYKDVYVGEVVPYTPHICGGWVIEGLQEDAVNECDEVADEWMTHVTQDEEKDLSDMLTAAFMAWAKKYKYMPDFDKIFNVQHYLMPTDEEVQDAV